MKSVLDFEKVNPLGASSRPDLLRYQSIAVLQYGCTIDALYIRPIQSLQNLGPIYFPGKNHRAENSNGCTK